MAAEAHAVPATAAAAPWLDGRPVLEFVADAGPWRPGSDGPIRFVRFADPLAEVDARCGLLDGGTVRELSDGLFSAPTGRVFHRSDLRLLSPLDSEGTGAVSLIEAGAHGRLDPVRLGLAAGDPLGPSSHFALRASPWTVRNVLGLAAVGPSRALAVTGGTLLEGAADGTWRLALGPALVVDPDPSALRTVHGLPTDVAATLESLMKDGRREGGGLILFNRSGQTHELRAGAHDWITATRGVGELRTRIGIG